MSTTPATTPAPLASTIAPATAAPNTIVTTGNAPAGPVYVLPAHEADDEMLNLASTMGLGADLGLPAPEAAKPEVTPATQPAATVAPATAPPAAGTPPVIPADETPEQKAGRLEAELKALKDSLAGNPSPAAVKPVADPAPVTVAPTAESPLANLRNAEQLAQAEEVASELQAWAVQNRDGGEIPLALAQKLENAEAIRTGRAPAKLTEALVLPKEGAAQIEAMAGKMLTQFVPKRREFLQQQTQAIEAVRSESPEFLDVQKPQGQLVSQLANRFPALLADPLWPLVLRDMASGYQTRVDAEKAKGTKAPEPKVQTPAPATVQDTTGKTIPLAPAAPLGGLVPTGTPVSQQQIDAAQERLNKGTHSDDDLITLSAAAV